jgi:hypothetical protein
MNNKKMVSAFSIIEAIVSMAITAIIMSIIFVVFSIVTERMMDYKNQNELICDLNRLTYSFNKDIFENEKMNIIDNEIVFKSYSGESVKYSFLEEYTLRNNEVFIDTFRIKTKQIDIDTVKNRSGRLVFTKLKVNIEANENTMNLKFYKRIYANELLKNNNE